MQTALNYQKLSIYAALICLGYVACLFLTYGFIVMPGLATIDDRAFVAAFQGLETRFQSIENQSVLKHIVSYNNVPAFIAFPGSVIFTLIAFLVKPKSDHSKWIFVTLVMFSIGMITTVLYNLPANEFIFSAGNPNLIDASAVREEFNEFSWAYWNHFRTLTTSCAFFCLYRVLLKLKSGGAVIN